MATKRTISSSAASSGSRLPRADIRRWRTSAITGPAAVIMSTEKRSRIEPVRRWMASSTVIRPLSSVATAPRPCWKAAFSGADSAAARSMRSAWLSRRPSRRSSIASRGLTAPWATLVAVVRSSRASLSRRSM